MTAMTTTAERQRPLVLVADDDADILAIVTFHLERTGYDTVRASDGEEALSQAIDHRPDLAVLDVMMPKLNGYELTRRIRENETVAHMPIVLLTARVQASDVMRGFDVGADDYIRKPFSPQELRVRVQSILGRN